jgi:hypothetical protein
MGRMSFSQELRSLGESSQEVNAGECWTEVLRLHRELGRAENALGVAAFTLRYGERGDWRCVLRDAAAQTLREARRAASRYDADRLREAAGCYSRLARCGFGEASAVMLAPGERAAASNGNRGRPERFGHVAPEVRWTDGRTDTNGRRRGRGRGGRGRNRRGAGVAAAA